MRLSDGIRVLALTGTIAGTAVPAAQAMPPMEPSGVPAAAPVVHQQPDRTPDWVLIGAGAGVVVLIGGVAGARRVRWHAPQSRSLS